MGARSPLPEEKMPSCWEQEERMNALFSPFRSRSANPQDWISKYKFWQKLIYERLSHTMECSFSISDLNEAFRRKGCRPLCIVTVVEELHRNNEIMLETEFLQEPCESWAAWSISIFVKKPIVWSLSKLKSYVVNTTPNEETKYIHLKILKELADIVLFILNKKQDRVLVPFSDILECSQEHTNGTISKTTVMLSLIWLRRMKKVDFKYEANSHELLVKCMMHLEDSITEVEENLYQLQKQEHQLANEIDLLEETKTNILNETKSYLSKGLRQVAKTHLRKKAEIEKTIGKRLLTLENLRSLIASIQDSHSNSTVLSAYQIGTDTLKKLSQDGLNESNVQDIMDELSQTLEEHKEVQTILSDTIKMNESDAELEKELEELLKSDKRSVPIEKTAMPVTQTPVKDLALSTSIEELEQSLKNLSVKDTPLSTKVANTARRVESKKKILSEPQCS